MPTYDFECLECGHLFEKMQGMNDPNPPCPNPWPPDLGGHPHEDGTAYCDGKTKKLITCSSFVLKGDGWATDGYGGGSSQ